MKEISNDEFDAAYKDKENKNIIRAATKRYSGALSSDIQSSCGMHGLWRCLKNHDPKYGRKFTTSLFIHVDWECKRELSQAKKKRVSFLGEMDKEVASTYPSGNFFEMIECLSDKQQQIVYERFYENKTLEEIGKSQGYTKEAARQNINKIIEKLKSIQQGDKSLD